MGRVPAQCRLVSCCISPWDSTIRVTVDSALTAAAGAGVAVGAPPAAGAAWFAWPEVASAGWLPVWEASGAPPPPCSAVAGSGGAALPHDIASARVNSAAAKTSALGPLNQRIRITRPPYHKILVNIFLKLKVIYWHANIVLIYQIMYSYS